ncbi:hypothetical protein SSX86_015334 [Deinandra increscens subsp. villosa]|uniref:Uncharacterized protein n=1 Tax=Deinandra increscens subsp. villosa TaxID=3103831 RepID=A0AAP0D456_9ASTR
MLDFAAEEGAPVTLVVEKLTPEAAEDLEIKGKIFAKTRYEEKPQMKKTLAMDEESSSRRKVDDDVHDGVVPAYLLDRDATTRANICCLKWLI